MSYWREAVHCRNRAEILRTIAHETELDAYKTALREVAEHYDALAARIERETKTNDRR